MFSRHQRIPIIPASCYRYVRHVLDIYYFPSQTHLSTQILCLSAKSKAIKYMLFLQELTNYHH